mmetsp:Transcript_14199/g.24983  ORF Transcript_14199/g.24983 Transcript_14199/m.24983 type:complete len:241 (-) Transcript_14199:965-1687(-)
MLCVRRVMRGMARILVVWIMLVLQVLGMLWMLGVRHGRGRGVVLRIVKTMIVRRTLHALSDAVEAGLEHRAEVQRGARLAHILIRIVSGVVIVIIIVVGTKRGVRKGPRLALRAVHAICIHLAIVQRHAVGTVVAGNPQLLLEFLNHLLHLLHLAHVELVIITQFIQLGLLVGGVQPHAGFFLTVDRLQVRHLHAKLVIAVVKHQRQICHLLLMPRGERGLDPVHGLLDEFRHFATHFVL